MRKNHHKMVEDFANRKEAVGDKVPETGQRRWKIENNGENTFLYSYKLLIARQYPNGQIKLLDSKHSPSKTTTMQINAVKEFFRYDSSRLIMVDEVPIPVDF